MKIVITFAIATLLVGCASTGGEYRTVYDHKYNEARLVKNDSAGTFVGTSAVRQPTARAAAQHP